MFYQSPIRSFAISAVKVREYENLWMILFLLDLGEKHHFVLCLLSNDERHQHNISFASHLFALGSLSDV